MPVRTFDRVDDRIVTGLGSLGFAFGPGTIAAIVRKATNSGALETIFKAGTSGTSAQYRLEVGSTNIIRLACGSTTITSTIDLLAADGWCLIAATKPTGTVAGRIHKYNFGTATWSHVDTSSTVANSGVPATQAQFGATQAPASFYGGDIGIAAVWNSVLTDTQIETLVNSEAAWNSLSPIAKWMFNQASTTTAVQDEIGTADQTSIVGTSVTATDIPWVGGGGGIEEGSGNVAGVGGLSGSAKIAHTGGGSLSGASSLSGTASNTATTGGSLSATSGLSGAASRTLTGSGELAGTADLDGAGGLTRTGTGPLSSTSNLNGSAVILSVVTGGGALSSTSTLTGVASRTLGGYGALSGTSTLAGTVNGVWSGGGAMSGESSLVGAGSLGATFGAIKSGRISDVREGRISHIRLGRLS